MKFIILFSLAQVFFGWLAIMSTWFFALAHFLAGSIFHKLETRFRL